MKTFEIPLLVLVTAVVFLMSYREAVKPPLPPRQANKQFKILLWLELIGMILILVSLVIKYRPWAAF